MRRYLTCLSLAALALVGLPSGAKAQFSTYSSRPPFEALLGSSITDDYSSAGYLWIQSNAAMSAVFGETVYQSTGFNNLDIVVGGTYCAGCNGSFLLSFAGTSVATAGVGVFGVGFDLYNSTELPYTAFVTFGDGSSTNIALPATWNFTFFGLTSNDLISTIAFGLPNGATTQQGSFAIDNLTIGSTSTVPEPASMTLLATGLVCLVGAGMRRRKKA